MIKFVKNVIVFLIPLVCAFGIIAVSGEIMSYNTVINHQKRYNSLVGFRFTDPMGQIKYLATLKKKPKILVLGTSRTLQFRDYFFKKRNNFYNAGRTIKKIKDFNSFINILNADYIDIAIIGLDQYFFNKRWDDLSSHPATYLKEYSFTDVYKKQRVFNFIFHGRITINNLLLSKHIGLTAKVHNEGFRPDGSYYYARRIKNPEKSRDANFKDTFKRIEEGNSRFQYETNANKDAVTELKSFLQNCKDRKIHVIAFLPPFAPSVWERIVSRKSDYEYMFKLYKQLNPIFELYSFDFFDFSDSAKLGSTDNEALDGFHGSEVTHLRMMIEMSEKSVVLRQRVDLDNLRRMLNSRYSDREINQSLF